MHHMLFSDAKAISGFILDWGSLLTAVSSLRWRNVFGFLQNCRKCGRCFLRSWRKGESLDYASRRWPNGLTHELFVGLTRNQSKYTSFCLSWFVLNSFSRLFLATFFIWLGKQPSLFSCSCHKQAVRTMCNWKVFPPEKSANVPMLMISASANGLIFKCNCVGSPLQVDRIKTILLRVDTNCYKKP